MNQPITVVSNCRTTIISSPHMMVSFAEVPPEDKIVKIYVDAKSTIVYQFSDAIEKSGLATVILANQEKGFLVIEKSDTYQRHKLARIVMKFIKN